MLDLTPLATKDCFEMPEHVRRKEYFLNWHKYLLLKADEAIAKADYVNHSGEVSVGYFDYDEKKYGDPDFILNEKGVEDE